MQEPISIPALGDNVIYIYRYKNNKALAVDPGDYSPVAEALKKYDLNLTTILATHHHWDHVGGIAELKKRTGCKVIGSDKQRIGGIDCIVEDGQILTIGNTKIQVIATPGHTRTSVCYYLPPAGENQTGILWTGDTMFVGGCGRLLECNAQTMWDSLQKIAALPNRTRLYCGHDYTLENYEFALEIEPTNQAVEKCLSEAQHNHDQGKNTVSSTISQEKETNIFLLAGTQKIKTTLGITHATDVETFAELRRLKDRF
ncbi:MAG: hydroxyacylglutathione hydrolase [Sedimentisphaerales bacterium]|nr:hydroxyacylglutathione hydrolase [Sedimentisphaerales bacterium]